MQCGSHPLHDHCTHISSIKPQDQPIATLQALPKEITFRVTLSTFSHFALSSKCTGRGDCTLPMVSRLPHIFHCSHAHTIHTAATCRAVKCSNKGSCFYQGTRLGLQVYDESNWPARAKQAAGRPKQWTDYLLIAPDLEGANQQTFALVKTCCRNRFYHIGSSIHRLSCTRALPLLRLGVIKV